MVAHACYKQKTSETFNIILSQKNDLLFIIYSHSLFTIILFTDLLFQGTVSLCHPGRKASHAIMVHCSLKFRGSSDPPASVPRVAGTVSGRTYPTSDTKAR